MAFDLGSLLQNYLGGSNTNATAPDAERHFDQASQAASPDLLSRGLSAMFKSDATPPFAQMAGQLFDRSNPNQQAGLLNQLIAGMGPGVLASLAGGAGGSGLGAILARLTGGNPQATVTPDQAKTVTPDQVQVIADHATQANPGLIDTISGFYAQHPDLVKSVGTAALGIVLANMAQHHNS